MNGIVKINKNEFNEMNNYLKEGNDLSIYGLEKDSTLLSLKTTFVDQYKAIIEVFTGQESVMATAYLYNQEGECVEYIESDEGLCVEYAFEFNDCKYTLVLDLE